MQERPVPLFAPSSGDFMPLISPKQDTSILFMSDALRNSDGSQISEMPRHNGSNRSSRETSYNAPIRLPEGCNAIFSFDNSLIYTGLRSSTESLKMKRSMEMTEVMNITASIGGLDRGNNRGSKSLFNDEESLFHRNSNLSGQSRESVEPNASMQDIEPAIRRLAIGGILAEPMVTEPMVTEQPMMASSMRSSLARDSMESYAPRKSNLFEIAEESYKEDTKESQTFSQDSEDLSQGKCCGCKKTMCIQLHCQCFARQEFCTNCDCAACKNTIEFEDDIKKAIAKILKKNPEGLNRRMAVNEDTERINEKLALGTGCNCSRSKCKNNYCMCYRKEMMCGESCTCSGCKNHPTEPKAKKR